MAIDIKIGGKGDDKVDLFQPAEKNENKSAGISKPSVIARLEELQKASGALGRIVQGKPGDIQAGHTDHIDNHQDHNDHDNHHDKW